MLTITRIKPSRNIKAVTNKTGLNSNNAPKSTLPIPITGKRERHAVPLLNRGNQYPKRGTKPEKTNIPPIICTTRVVIVCGAETKRHPITVRHKMRRSEGKYFIFIVVCGWYNIGNALIKFSYKRTY